MLQNWRAWRHITPARKRRTYQHLRYPRSTYHTILHQVPLAGDKMNHLDYPWSTMGELEVVSAITGNAPSVRSQAQTRDINSVTGTASGCLISSQVQLVSLNSRIKDAQPEDQRKAMATSSSYVAAALILVAVLLHRRNRRKSLPLPPGPKGLPFIGNLLDIPGPQEHQWLVYKKWSETYGVTFLGLYTAVLTRV